ncbi:MAG: hypothetical protein Q9218_005673 [Villophora microphyllina]
MSETAVMSETNVTLETNDERAEVTAKWGDRKTIDDYSEAPSWAANAARYEWSDEYGDVGPEDKELEKMLFHAEEKMEVGDHLQKLTNINVVVESENHIQPIVNFDDAGLHPIIRDNVKRCGFEIPTPVQGYCLPAVLKNLDVIGIAQTGSGKTAAYLIPTISKLMGKAKKLCGPRPNVTAADFDVRTHGVRAEPLILVIAPTRELATQIFDEARRLCYRSMLRPCVAYGGAPTREQADQLRKGCDILVATPGRLLDFLQRNNLLSLSRVKYTIVDEADEFVSGDWETEMDVIMGGADANADSDHVYLFFSATFNKQARNMAKKYLSSDHVRVRVGRAGSTHVNVVQKIVFVEESKKKEALWDLLMTMPPARTMIFTNWKKEADLLDDFLWNKGLPSTSIHSDRTQREREDAIRAFKLGKAPILITTGVSARGLDVKHTLHIINYDFPTDINEYVHRIGRTARIGNLGLATSFYNDKNGTIAEDLVKLLLETDQEIPDFLEEHKPSGALEFHDDSGDEEEEEAEVGASADTGAGGDWGAGGGAGGDAKAEDTGGDWGATKKTNGTAKAETNGGDSWNADNAGAVPDANALSMSTTRQQTAGEVLEPRPKEPLPSLGQVMDENERAVNLNGFVSSSGLTKPTPTAEDSSIQANNAVLQGVEGTRSKSRANGFKVEAPTPSQIPNLFNGEASDNEDWKADPYQERADEIGLSHRIPGIGHLGDLLTPPGWTTEDDPVHPKKARHLHREACEAAKGELNASMAELTGLKGTAYEEACQSKDEEWQSKMNLYKVIFEQRVKVYWTHHDRKHKPTEQERPKQYPVQNHPQINGFGDHRPSQQVPAVVVTKAPKTNGGYPAQVVTLPPQRYGYGQPEPSPKLLSPSFLDPSLHDGTLESVIQQYQLKKAQLEHDANENELRLKQCLIKYGPHVVAETQGQYRPGPNFQLQTGWAQSQMGNEIGYVNNNVNYSNGIERQGPTSHHYQYRYRYPEPPTRNALGIYDEPCELALSSPAKSVHPRDPDEESTPRPAKRQAKTKGNSPKKSSPKKGTPQKTTTTTALAPKKAKKSTCWYAAELEKADLPTSTISAEAMQAGLDYNPYGPTRKVQMAEAAGKAPAASKTEIVEIEEPSNKGIGSAKKRRKKGDEPLPVPAFQMDAGAIKRLFKKGLPVKYTGDGENPYLSDGDGDKAAGTRFRNGDGVGNGKIGGAEESLFVGKPSPTYPSDSSSGSEDNDDKDGTCGSSRRKSGSVRAPAISNTRKRKTLVERQQM